MARAAILAALVAAVVVAAASAALTPSDCSSSSTPVIGSCIKSSVGAGNSNNFAFTIAPGDIDPTKKLQIYFWNVDQSTSGWNDSPSTYVKLQTPASDQGSNAPTTTSFSLINGVTTGSSPSTVQFMLSKELSISSNNLCAGTYQVRVDRTGKSNSMAFALYIRWADVDPAKMWAGAGETVTFTNAILPGDANSVYIKGDFNTIGYTVKNLGAQIAPNTDAGKANIWGWSLTGTNALNTVTLVKDETSLPTLKVSSYNNVRPNSPGNAKFTFTAPAFTTANFASGYNWASNGPFLDVTFTMNTVEEWPTYASTSGTLDYTNDGTDTKDNQVIMMLKPGPMWWKLQIPTSVTDVIATPNVANAPLDIKWAWSDALTANPETASSYANSYRTTAPMGIYNSDFYNPGATPPTVSTKWLGAGMEQTPKIMFLYFTKSACDGTQKLDYSITYQAPVAVPGECNSYVDCNPTEGDHPGDARKDYSANSDLKRFQHCVVQQTFNDPTDTVFGFGPGSTCVECTSDCDCNEGQYCYTGDTGICSGSNRNWICDSWGYNRRNLCVKKSTDVLGSTCRTDQATALATATALWTSSTPPTGNLPVMAESGQSITIGGDDDMSTNDDITGYGFCGEVRYYNSTPDANPSWNLKSASMVRKVLWEGRCFNKKCYECNPTATMGGSVTGYSDCTNDRSCVNGAIVDNMVTDFTIRTYTKNTIAGTMLAAVMMIILLNCCTLIHICCTCRIGVKKDE